MRPQHVIVAMALILAGAGPLRAQDLGALFRKTSRSVVVVRTLERTLAADPAAGLVTAGGLGSGTIISADGKILAQDVGMLLSAGRDVVVADPLVYSILVGNDAWDPEILAKGLREGDYDAVVLNRPVEQLNDEEWTTLWISGPARRALSDRYRLESTFAIEQSWVFLEPERYLYVPKEIHP